MTTLDEARAWADFIESQGRARSAEVIRDMISMVEARETEYVAKRAITNEMVEAAGKALLETDPDLGPWLDQDEDCRVDYRNLARAALEAAYRAAWLPIETAPRDVAMWDDHEIALTDCGVKSIMLSAIREWMRRSR